MATKKTTVDADATLMEQAFEATKVAEAAVISATDKLTVLNTSDSNVCLTSGILKPGEEGIATRAELGTLWQYLELAE
jgi:hypothetical protein